MALRQSTGFYITDGSMQMIAELQESKFLGNKVAILCRIYINSGTQMSLVPSTFYPSPTHKRRLGTQDSSTS
jgi:hypothetical protein